MRYLLFVFALFATGCIASQNAALVLPTQSEIGVVTMTDGEHSDTGLRYKTALSWASVSPNGKTPVDVGIGYQMDHFAATPGEGSTSVHGKSKMQESEDTTLFHGPVVEFSKNMGGTEHRRQWLGARVEMPMRQVNSQTYYGLGASLRASVELFMTAKGSNVLGAIGLGSYVETGFRRIPGGKQALVMSTGLSLRLPLAYAN